MKAKGFTHDNVDNKTVDWYTPKWIFDRLMIQFDLDPCQPEGGIPWIPARYFYTKETDGLKSKWSGNVWLNPPYGKDTKAWLKKMHEHRQGIALVFARTDCAWFRDYIYTADAILFLNGRVKFIDGLGVTGKAGAGCGSMLVAWGYSNLEALKNMKDVGCYFAR